MTTIVIAWIAVDIALAFALSMFVCSRAETSSGGERLSRSVKGAFGAPFFSNQPWGLK
jgi:hypothetical protein